VDFLIVLAVVLVVVVLVSAPLRRAGAGRDERRAADADAERAELEAAREAKYREIRDAELDRRTGKLSEEDWHTLDGALRGEAVDLLRRLDRVHGGGEDG